MGRGKSLSLRADRLVKALTLSSWLLSVEVLLRV